MSKPGKENRSLKPDAQAFDEIRIRTIPRYKTSGLSGDEWRISAVVEFYRNGQVICETGPYRNVEVAAVFAASDYLRMIDEGKGYFAGEGDVCDQEGCCKTATVVYRVLRRFSRDNGHIWNEPIGDVEVRKFCEVHKRRGDCGFDDADANYELIA